jgi:uncharacterized caspase-like protein
MRPQVLLLGALLLMGLGLAPAHADKRVALVIGNSAYKNVAALENPRNDAKLVADTLRGLGFVLVGGGAQPDLDKRALDRAVQDFGRQLSDADVGLFYYAGHGLQVGGENYLVPVDANPSREVDVDFQMLDTNLLLRQMQAAGTRLNIVILDACRNNPFVGRALSVARARDPENTRLRGAASGLAEMPVADGTLISFSTQPGSVAQDGAGANSPYAKALAETIRKPGLSVLDAFNQVGLQVKSATKGAQRPWVSYSSIVNFFFIAAPAAAPPAASAAPAVDAAERAWNAAQSSKSPAVLEEFIRRFGDSFYAALARERLDELKANQLAAASPPAAAPAVCRARYPNALARIPLPNTLQCKHEVAVLDGTCGPGKIRKIIAGCNEQGTSRMTFCVPCDIEFGRLGVQLQKVNGDISDSLKLPQARGVLIIDVSENGAAKPAGIKPADVVVKMDGQEIREPGDLSRVVAQTPADKSVDLVIIRNGKEETLPVTLGP